MAQGKIPVTILTGFLGSGKTTLLNHILKDSQGHRIAVIENEFGAINVDHHLIENVDEEIIELQNGCICCQIRGDFIKAMIALSKKTDQFDYILIETTGMADPKPLIQTFLAEPFIRSRAYLDGVVTVVDSANVLMNWERAHEIQEQIAHADLILLNKSDLVSEEQLSVIQTKIEAMNPLARIVRSMNSRVPTSTVVGRKDFEKPLTKIFCPVEKSFLKPKPHKHTKVVSEIFEVPGDLSLGHFDGLLQALLGVWSSEIFRIKGILRFHGSDALYALQVVHHLVDIKKLEREKTPANLNQIVVIARNNSFLQFLTDGLRACATQDPVQFMKDLKEVNQ